jgi:hypothetical protein
MNPPGCSKVVPAFRTPKACLRQSKLHGGQVHAITSPWTILFIDASGYRTMARTPYPDETRRGRTPLRSILNAGRDAWCADRAQGS